MATAQAPRQPRALTLLFALALFALCSLALALSLGSVPIAPDQVWSALLTSDASLAQRLVMELRLPRALAAFAVGGLLSVSGVLIQVLLRNPLGDPYVLGVSGGAATGALLAMLLGLPAVLLDTAAFVGALASIALVFALARGEGAWLPPRLLLTGVVLASGWSALISFLLSVSPANRLPGMLFWIMGDLGDASRPGLALTVLAAAMAFSWTLARPLNLLARGDLQAAALGVETAPLRLGILLLASLLTAVAVTLGGGIGFVGLVVPHLLRLLGAGDHRLLLPCAPLLGGGLLVAADTLARTLLAPQQLPVGVVTALLGVPLFLYLLNRPRAIYR